MKTDNYVHYDVQRLRGISIRKVASQFGTVKRSGSSYMAICPWHNDHHPSLSLVEKTNKNYCHCFSCDKGGDVISYVMAAKNVDFQGACEWLSNQYGILTSSNPSYAPLTKNKAADDDLPPSYIPKEMVDRLVSTDNSLCQCLMKWFRPEAVEWVTEEYRIGCYTIYDHDDWTVFPSIDITGRVCNLKIQWYETDPLSPNYSHCPKGHSYWLASIWQKQGILPSGNHYTTYSLFGEHLLDQYTAQTIALVESPKNAIIGALEYPQMLWIAVGNKGMLRSDVLKPLQGRDVIVFPDRDAIGQWRDEITKMTGLANFTISDFCEKAAPKEALKYDIADYIIDQHKKGI